MRENHLTQQNGRLRARRMTTLLEQELEKIPDVQTWAARARVSRGSLNRIIKRHFGVAPKRMLRRHRYRMIAEMIKKDPQITSYAAALNAGLRDDKALYKFLDKYYGTTFTQMRKDVLRSIGEASRETSDVKRET
ncbi:helix-turn-helix domain-containing protein [Rhodohalobacter mucosus]|nr:helix-turn-helix domain-containing protein [Rhodohalobacter mucosus]